MNLKADETKKTTTTTTNHDCDEMRLSTKSAGTDLTSQKQTAARMTEAARYKPNALLPTQHSSPRDIIDYRSRFLLFTLFSQITALFMQPVIN